jgi:hypothetical protein
MDLRTTYLSFWDIEMSNVPVEVPFRRRVLSTAEARRLMVSARASGTLACLTKDDLGAPYCEHEREKHRELCAALRDHCDIEIRLKDFFSSDCANPLSFAEIGDQRSLLVVDCHYAFADDIRRGAKVPDTRKSDEASKGQAVPAIKKPMKLIIVPDSIRFYLFEQIDVAADSTARSSGDESDNDTE